MIFGGFSCFFCDFKMFFSNNLFLVTKSQRKNTKKLERMLKPTVFEFD